ncbi:MAG TPA: glycosyltransferase [Nocardioides sp.]|nr:glycosyltransferase [Nocardioides sp.]
MHLGSPLPARRRRIALYSHDTMGLGHTRRNILIAAALVADNPATDVLLLTGAPEATGLPLPPSTDVVTLPALRKHEDGHYSPRSLSCSLEDLLRTRSAMIEGALSAFDPDLVIVDKVARGVEGELDAALTALRDRGRTRVVLGLRDVLDVPAVAREEWEQSRTTETLRELYDAVWLYGDPDIYDPVLEYHLPLEVAGMISYTGYLAGPRPPSVRAHHVAVPTPPEQPFVLCLVGGGQDGHRLARAFAEAAYPRGHQGVLITGGHMPASERDAVMLVACRRHDMTVHDFVPGADDFIRHASAAVSMGGYNSVCELLAAGTPALLVPRVTPRAEQAVRAERLARAGWVDTIAPAEATPERLGRWLSEALRSPSRPRGDLDRGGLERVPRLAEELLGNQVPGEVRDVAV